MDHFVNILVRFFVFLSRFASILSKIGLINYRSFDDWKNDPKREYGSRKPRDPKLHILLVGYNGVRNTGADVRTAEIARQLCERLGKDRAEISVMALDEENIRCYFGSDIHLIHFTTIYFTALFKACCANQVAILCEGSTLKSKFANALTLYFCEAAGIMKRQHKPCIAYGSEAGEMDAFLERTVKKLCSDTYIIARNQNSLDRIHQLGLAGHLGTDTAWEFDSTSYTQWANAHLRESGWDGTAPLLGIAPINPFWWPVKPSLTKWLRSGITGDHSLQFQLWYFFSWSKQREQQFENYLNAIASAIREFVAKHACYVVIFGMERLDADACNKLRSKLAVPTSVFLSSDNDGYKMAALLRQLSVLITSRYHAEVLSMAAKVPCIAVSMDERLDNIMQDMDMSQNQLLHADDDDLSAELLCALDFVQIHRQQIKDKIRHQLVRYQNTLDEMGDFLVDWLFAQRDTA